METEIETMSELNTVVGCMSHWKVKMIRIKQMTAPNRDEGKPEMASNVFSPVAYVAMNSSLENGQSPRIAI